MAWFSAKKKDSCCKIEIKEVEEKYVDDKAKEKDDAPEKKGCCSEGK